MIDIEDRKTIIKHPSFHGGRPFEKFVVAGVDLTELPIVSATVTLRAGAPHMLDLTLLCGEVDIEAFFVKEGLNVEVLHRPGLCECGRSEPGVAASEG